ncbi:cupredoxin domain-containing protein [Patescibacteria group bacterium]|nr:cupredoxin domain-containing protein [Patescibacteria group bacterium]
MSKRHLLGFVAFSLLLAGCYHAGGGLAPATTTSEGETHMHFDEENGKENTVVYTDAGFSPSAITVQAGTAVTFVNESSGVMWVASAVHPTHQNLRGFDQLKSTGHGTSYSYTFTQAGEWKYHDHRSPGETGTVVVQ